MSKLELKKISHAFADAPEVEILKDVSLHVNEGEIVSIIGPSGGGKTTLFHIAAGLLRPTAG